VGVFLLLAPVVSGCAENDQSTLSPKSSASDQIARLWWVMLIASAVIFGVVLVLLFVAVLRRRGADSPPLSSRRGGLWIPAVGGIVVPIVILAGLFALTLRTLPKTSPASASATGLTIEVVGRQWFWEIRYPGTGAVTANEIHIPARTRVNVVATTGDVIHSFWVPQLNRKIDMIPGRRNRVLLTSDKPGRYRGQCAEFCGLEHAHMAMYVYVQEPADFDRWLRGEAADARPPASAAARAGRAAFMSDGCASCHAIRGTAARGDVGPDLTHVGSRASIAALTLPNTAAAMAAWLRDPQHVKPGNRMPDLDLSRRDIRSLVAYLQGLR
jgi:cytochrome c oxidase subunit II